MADVAANFDDTRVQEVIRGFEVEGSFGYTVDYAKYVNYPTSYSGTAPPFEPIRKWVHRKWNDLDAGLKETAFREGMTQEEHKDAVAHVVQKAIAENGTEGVYFAERAVAEVERQAEAFAARYENSEDPHAPFKIVRDVTDAAFGISQDIIAEEATDTGNLLQSGYVQVEEVEASETFENNGGSA
jgi:hypothetical protein